MTSTVYFAYIWTVIFLIYITSSVIGNKNAIHPKLYDPFVHGLMGSVLAFIIAVFATTVRILVNGLF